MNDPELVALTKEYRAQRAAVVSSSLRGTARLFMILGAAFLIIAAAMVVLALAAAVPYPFPSIAMIASPILFVVGGLFYLVGRRVGAADRDHILATGLPGRATLVSVGASRMSVQMGSGMAISRTKLELDVQLDDGRTLYRVDHHTVVPLDQVARLRPGTVLAVRVDPKRPQQLAVAWDGTPLRTRT